MRVQGKTTGLRLPQDPAQVLHERAASIRAVERSEMNAFTECLAALTEISAALDAPIAIVGGLAAIHHKARVTTLDVDIVVPKARLGDLVTEGPRHGLVLRRESPRGWHTFVFPHAGGAVDVHVIPEGESSPRDPEHAPRNPGPEELGVHRGLGYAEFAPWVVMKLVANREKDRYHLVEALKHANQVQVSEVVLKLRSLHSSYLAELERLVRAAEAERDQENW